MRGKERDEELRRHLDPQVLQKVALGAKARAIGLEMTLLSASYLESDVFEMSLTSA